MNYVTSDLMNQMLDTLRANDLFKGVTVARHSGEVNILMFTNPAYHEGLIKKLPFVLLKYAGREAIKRDSPLNLWEHDITFTAYVGAKSLKLKDDATEECETYLAKIFDLWNTKYFYSQQSWATGAGILSGTQITTTGFRQLSPLMEAGGQDETVIVTLPEITLYQTSYKVRMLAYTP